jgi:hypothetical protein
MNLLIYVKVKFISAQKNVVSKIKVKDVQMEENVAYYFPMKSAYVKKMLSIIVLKIAFLKVNQGIAKNNVVKYMDMKESMFVRY